MVERALVTPTSMTGREVLTKRVPTGLAKRAVLCGSGGRALPWTACGWQVVGQADTNRLNTRNDVSPVHVFKGQCAATFEFIQNLAHLHIGFGVFPARQVDEAPLQCGTDHFAAELFDKCAKNCHSSANMVHSCEIAGNLCPCRPARRGN